MSYLKFGIFGNHFFQFLIQQDCLPQCAALQCNSDEERHKSCPRSERADKQLQSTAKMCGVMGTSHGHAFLSHYRDFVVDYCSHMIKTVAKQMPTMYPRYKHVIYLWVVLSGEG